MPFAKEPHKRDDILQKRPIIGSAKETYTYRITVSTENAAGWRRLIGCPKLQIIFYKRATKYRSLLRKMTYKDKGSYESSPPCTSPKITLHVSSPSRKRKSLQHTATHCNTLQHTATHCNTLQHTATHCKSAISRISNPSYEVALVSRID